METLRIGRGHESINVTLAYLNGNDAESEEAQEQTTAALRCAHKTKNVPPGDFVRRSRDLPFSFGAAGFRVARQNEAARATDRYLVEQVNKHK